MANLSVVRIYVKVVTVAVIVYLFQMGPQTLTAEPYVISYIMCVTAEAFAGRRQSISVLMCRAKNIAAFIAPPLVRLRAGAVADIPANVLKTTALTILGIGVAVICTFIKKNCN